MRKFLEEFKAFALRGNVVDMAIGVVVGGAFTAIVTAMKDNFIMPLIEFILGNATYRTPGVGDGQGGLAC